MSRRLFLGLMGLILAALWGGAQQTIIAEKPLASNSGRVVTIKEEMRITCNGGDYQIKSIQRMDASPGGDLFVQDEQKQILQFSSEGRFVRSLVPRGQGPGELDKIESFVVLPSEIIVFGTPHKFLHFDFEGRKIKELGGLKKIFSKESVISSQFLNFENGGYTMIQERFNRGTRGPGWVTIPWIWLHISADGGKAIDIGSFLFPYFAVSGLRNVNLTRTGQFTAAALGSSRYAVSDPREYAITVYDLANKTRSPAFVRPYLRVESQIPPPRGSALAQSHPEVWKFDPDIIALRVLGDRILAFTSTMDREKGILVDVWDNEGRYTDHFYLALPKSVKSARAATRILFAGGRVYFPTVNDENEPVIIIGVLQGY